MPELPRVMLELGSNWYNADNKKAQAMVKTAIADASEYGCFALKLQLFHPDRLYSGTRAPTHKERVRPYAFPVDWLHWVQDECHAVGLKLVASVFDVKTLEDVWGCLDAIKIASGDLTFMPLLEHAYVACERYNMPLILSTGAATLMEVDRALAVTDGLSLRYLMHCVSCYPTPFDQANVSAIVGLNLHKFDLTSITQAWSAVRIGYSDHTANPLACSLAHALGAELIEVHYAPKGTWRESPDFGEHAYSYTGLGVLMDTLKQTVLLMGDGDKAPMPCEMNERLMARRAPDGLRPTYNDNTWDAI